MYVIIAPIQIKPGCKEQFMEAIVPDAIGSVNDEPGLPPVRRHPGCGRREPRLVVRSVR